jgi:TM2 domain-containing membrane protein YozV
LNQANATHSALVGYIIWIFGFLGAHRFYMGKWVTGIVYLFTGGLVGIGLLYDLWTLNGQVSEINRREMLVGR